MTRLVLIGCKTGSYTVHDKKVILAHYEQESQEAKVWLDKQEVEELRTATYKDKA